MARVKKELEPHPLVSYGEKRGWGYEKTAKFFRIPYATFRVQVRGFIGMSWHRAYRIEKRSVGEITAIELLRWHELNRREGY